VIDFYENERTSRRYAAVFFCFDHEIYDDTPLFNYQQCQFHYFYEFS